MCPAVIHLVAFWERGDEDGGESDPENECDASDYYVIDEDADLRESRVQRRRRRGSSCCQHKKMSLWAVAKDVTIVIVALVALVSGTYASLVDIVAFYGGGGGAHAVANATADTAAAAAAAAAAVATTTIGPGPESAFLVATGQFE